MENTYFIAICNYSKLLLEELKIYFDQIDMIIEKKLPDAETRIRSLLITMIKTHVEIFE